MHEFKITYKGQEICGATPEEAAEKCLELEKARQQEFLSTCRIAGGTYCYNGAHDGIEIRFARKPDLSVIDELTANGWRWHRAKRCWYAKRTRENMAFAEDVCRENENTSEQERQKLLLSARTRMEFGFSWRQEYESYSSDQLRALIEADERWKLCCNLPSDYFRRYGIHFSFDSDIEFLRSLEKPGEEFEYQCRRIEKLVENDAKKLLSTAYWHQVGLYKAEMSQRNFTEKEHPLGLKQSSFWENFRLYGDLLQPIDIARRMGFSYLDDRLEKARNPKCESRALAYVERLPVPDYSYEMKDAEFSKAMAVLYYKGDKQWKSVCRKYCLENSKAPDEFVYDGSQAQFLDGIRGKDEFMHRAQVMGNIKIEFINSNTDGEIPF